MIDAPLQSDLDRLAALLLPEYPSPYWLAADELTHERLVELVCPHL